MEDLNQPFHAVEKALIPMRLLLPINTHWKQPWRKEFNWDKTVPSHARPLKLKLFQKDTIVDSIKSW